MSDVRKFNQEVGRRLKKLRKDRGLTLQQLSRLTGISVSMLSTAENGKAGLSQKNMIVLSGQLNTPIAYILSMDNAPPVGERSIVPYQGGKVIETRAVDYEVLTENREGSKIFYLRARVKARDIASYGEYSRHPGEEFFTVTKGTIRLYTDLHEPLDMPCGHSICFDSMVGHAYIATSEETPELLMVNTLGKL